MKKKILLTIMSFMILSSIAVSAASRSSLEKEKFTGWNQDTYYQDGNMVTNNWINIRDKQYYLKADGNKAIGWLQLNNNWYYFNSEGAKEVGWIFNNGKYYYLNDDGTMAHDAYIGSYYVSSDGSWTK